MRNDEFERKDHFSRLPTEQFNMPAIPWGVACEAEATNMAGHDDAMLDLLFQTDVSTTLEAMILEYQPEYIRISVRNIDDQHSELPEVERWSSDHLSAWRVSPCDYLNNNVAMLVICRYLVDFYQTDEPFANCPPEVVRF